MRRNAVKEGLAAVAATVAGLALTTSPALARNGYVPAGTFGSTGSAAGQFNGPVGVAVQESTGDVYVVDSGNKRVERFSGTGSFFSILNGNEVPGGGFIEPTYVATDNSGGGSQGQVYVADPGVGEVDAFDPSGKYLFQIAVAGIQAVTVDPAGHLWVWTSQASFEEYSSTGTLMLNQPVGRGTLPGIAVDSLGNVYVLYGSGGVGRYSPPAFEENNEGGSNATTLAINSATNEIFQDQGTSIVEWPPFGEGSSLWEKIEATIPGSLVESRGVAIDGATSELYASDFSTGEVEMFNFVLLPDASTDATSNLTPSSATIEATVNPLKTRTGYFFEWGETDSYGNSTPVTEIGEGESPVPVSSNLSGLEANTTYHYRIKANNEAGATFGNDETFTTPVRTPIIEGAPSASDMTRSGVVLHAGVDPFNSPATVRFSYVEATAYDPAADDPYAAGGKTAPLEIAGPGSRTVSQRVDSLKPATTYHYRASITSAGGKEFGIDGTFTTTPPTLPVAVTGESSGVSQNSVTIAGLVGTNGLPSTYGFEVATDTDYGPPTGLGSVGAGLNEAAVSLTLTGLQPGTTYHYRITATNLDGTSYGADETFTTSTFANTFATPPAPLPFVAIPSMTFPVEVKTRVTKKKAAPKRKTKRHNKTVKKNKHKKKK